MTSNALITTVALLPTFKPSSSTASFVIEDVMTWLGAISESNMCGGGRAFFHIQYFAFYLITCAQAHVVFFIGCTKSTEGRATRRFQ